MSWIRAFPGMMMLVLSLLIAAPASSQTFPELAGRRVVDQANLLNPEQERALTAKSAALEQRTGRQFVVATVNSLEGRTIEDYGYRLGRHWGIGSEEEDDGVILLVAPNERKVRIETGYGARVFVPDVISGRIIRNTILPRFRDGDMAGGIIAGADAIVESMRLSPEQARQRAAEAAEAAAEEQARAEGNWFVAPLVLGGMILGFVLLAMARGARGHRYHRGHGRRRRRGGFDAGDAAILLWGLSSLSHGSRRGWGGGGFGGFGGGGGFGGFSGGGGSFGGGGASGGW